MGIFIFFIIYFQNVRHQLTETKYKIYTKKKLKQKKITLVQLTDFHFDIEPRGYLDHEILENIIKRLKEIQPDYILLTGDYINHLIDKHLPMLCDK